MQPPSFEPISQRPGLKLPNNAYLGVWVVMNLEHFTFGKLGTAIQPHLNSYPEIANYGWRDYGNRVGIWRLFELFLELEIPVTAAVNGEICTLYPEIMEGIQRYGWEVMAHGINNSTGHSGMDRETEIEVIDKTLDLLEGVTGKTPKGWLTPGFSITESTFEFLHSAGIVYTADWVNDDQPYWYPLPNGRLLAIPYTIEANDITLCLSNRFSGAEFAQAIEDQFDQLWEEGQQQPRIMTIGLHPFIVGQPLRLKYLKQCLSHIKNKPNTWLTTGEGIYEWFNQLNEVGRKKEEGRRNS
ncbi:MAG: polysaccharide deacetylase family protein [Cyanomargarita calcarea GSE-NOS-MK-12-04C]|jgi:peptidoglycan/xylan/chitin deacetylase (PgdA/CDA1 family)|uniref:Polysaccharide deacetylase family protein n=1 Tax=Cyanomargarita calcarea GSE-NOS-MK-12-04C TaxID=2839659 RepID=A0A951QNC0_9CYAN|nr:polysaccharide deacetylase family protein [Cyanomargarita calcarea GSE-NOS-MK-12-04C]